MITADLFRVAMAGRVWTMTSGHSGFTYNNERYVPTEVSRTAIESKKEFSKANLNLTIPLDHELSQILLSAFSEERMTLNVYERDGTTATVAWKGRLVTIKPGDSTNELIFESVFTSLKRPGLRQRFQKGCRHPLYGRGCFLDPELFMTPGLLNALNGVILTIPEAGSQPSGYFNAGMIRAADGVLSYIVNHVGTQIEVQRLSYSLAKQFQDEGAGSDVKLYPGCNHTRVECHEKFNNRLNYGGFDWIPVKNPMGGGSII